MVKHIKAIALPLLLAYGVFAASAQANWADCVCRIQGQNAGGSGTLVAVSKDGHGLIISVAHVIAANGTTQGMIAEFPVVQQKRNARVLGTDRQYDLAALDIAQAPNVETPKAIVAAKREDGPFTCCGFPFYSRHELRWTKGEYLGYPIGGGSGPDCLPSMLHTEQHVASGYSGGGRFNRFGEYVGPISGRCGDSGRPMDKCWGASGKALLNFVGKFMDTNHANN